MPRPLRIQVENGIFHVYSRGNAKRPIFRDDADRLRFLRALREARDDCGWSILTYCLMPNHYHAVVRTPQPNLAEGMHHLGSSYAEAFNRREEVPGHVFQGRYGSRFIQEDSYLLATLAYVARNPVAAGLCARPEDWRWSGHRAIVGLSSSRLVDGGATLGLLAEDRATALAAYRHAVSWAPDDPPIPPRRIARPRPDLGPFLARGVEGLAEAHFVHGYSQREIAERLGCHPATVSRRLREFKARLQRRGADPL